MALRIPWDIEEAVLMLDMLLKSLDGKLTRKEAIRQVSEKLRRRAVNRGITIDDIFRNENGITFQMSALEVAYTGIKTKLKYTNRAIKNVLDCLHKLKNIELNNKIQKFIDHSKIEVYVNVQQTKIGGSLKISKKEENVKTRFGIFDNLIFEKSDSKGQLCNTIYDFIKYFPNFVSYQKKHNLEIGSLIKTYKAADAVKSKNIPLFKKTNLKRDGVYKI